MPGADYGFARAVSEVTTGFVLAILVKTIFSAFGMYYAVVLFNIMFIVLIVGLLDVMPFGSLAYLIGWLFGIITVGPFFLSLPELFLYLVVGLFVLCMKFNR